MPNELLIPYALNDNGALVHVDQVPTGKHANAICPSCREPLYAKNKGTRRRHHFAHAGAAKGCGEGWLHTVAKMLLVDRITRGMDHGSPLPIAVPCEECDCRVHHGNLLKGVDRVDMEPHILAANIRPDILLTGNKPKVVEIVHTHEPEQPVLDYVQTQNIPLVLLYVERVDDLGVIKVGELKPRKVPQAGTCPCKVAAGRKESTPCEWRYCDRCERVVKDQEGQFGGYGDHLHCVSCGEVMAYTKGSYSKHYCCSWTDRLGLPRCPDREPDHPLNATHDHCRSCGSRVTRKPSNGYFGTGVTTTGFYATCWVCHKGD